MNNLASALIGVEGERVALCDVAVSAVLQDLLAEVTVSQTYRNDERVNIEAVYTFPLPLDAVLLDLEVEIGGRVLKEVVVEKKVAEDRYEDAVESGDAAVMLEVIEPGLYTMNVGNLLPQETAKITFSYANLYRWAGDRLRFFLPTTIAPRFGESPHQPHQVPEASLTVENQFSLRLEIFGALRDAQFVCPSHAVELVNSPEKVVLSLQQPKAVMDRDFILNVKAPQATRSFVLCGQDGDGMAAVASFQPFFPGLQQPRPLNLAIVIDCSGSMTGDSIEQAKQALEGILDGLQPHDRVTLIAFGDSTSVFSDRPLPCNKSNLAKARQFAKALDANMGGTEIGNALRVAYSVLTRSERADLLLVTDGEVSDWEAVVGEARKSGNRIFTVGVGSAVSEAFVRGLAAATGGECELVSPREGMAERVVRHFERMRAPRAKRVEIRWPEGAANMTPSKIGALFEGDTVVACARFDRPPAHSSAILEVETDKGEVVRQELTIPSITTSDSEDGISTVARVAAGARLKELNDVAGLGTALRYRLMSPWTDWLVIADRADNEKAQELPVLRKVRQTLAAGWGGVGQVAACMDFVEDAPRIMRHASALDHRAFGDVDFALSNIRLSFAPEPGLPEEFRILRVLIQTDAAHAGAEDVLGIAGLRSEFEDLFERAAKLGVKSDVIATMVLAGLIDGLLKEFVSSEALNGCAEILEDARRLREVVKELIDEGNSVAHGNQRVMTTEDIFLVGETGRFSPEERSGVRALLNDVEVAIRRSIKRVRSPQRTTRSFYTSP